MNNPDDLKKLKKLKKKKVKKEGAEIDLKIKTLKAEELDRKIKNSERKKRFESLNTEGQFGSVAEPRKSLSTYLRNQNKAEVSFVSILDRKAAILIRICTGLISGLIVFNDFVIENVAMGETISQILLWGLMATLTTSILTTKPAGFIMRRFLTHSIEQDHNKIEENIFFMTHPYSLKEYEEAMSKVIKSQDLQIGNQVRANYVLAMNNRNKNKMLDLSYSFFLGTFLIVGITFMYGKFF